MLHLAYFADDFTGATDALESLSNAGLRTRLFLNPPTPAQCTGLDAIGVAGLTRSLAPVAMEAVLRPAFTALRALRPRHIHYKVCSTFDSSPAIGSIGRAIDIGAEIFGGRIVPVLAAAPALGRYCAFGHLFARYGIGSAGSIHRLDRHPSVSQHPVTPMTEADLRLHLGEQTSKRIGLLDFIALERTPDETAAALDALRAAGHDVVLIDALNAAHLSRIGMLLERLASQAPPVFSVGSSGIGAALGTQWSGSKAFPDATKTAGAHSGPLVILSGSCSPVTAGQIDWAIENGFTAIPFSPESLPAAVAALQSGRNTLVYTSRGQVQAPLPAAELGTQLGQLAREIMSNTGVRRLVIAGGDTSSYAARALGIESLDILAPFSPGAPLCRAQAPGSPADRMEVNFKGGQVGAPDYFEAIARVTL